jgi:hypothetical protein
VNRVVRLWTNRRAVSPAFRSIRDHQWYYWVRCSRSILEPLALRCDLRAIYPIRLIPNHWYFTMDCIEIRIVKIGQVDREAMSGKVGLIGRTLSIGIIAVSMVPGVARAENAAVWGQVGPWKILMDKMLGNGCFMVSDFSNGTSFRPGFNNVSHNVYFTMGNRAWSIEVGKLYNIGAQFDNSVTTPVRHWRAVGVDLGGYMDFQASFNRPARHQTLKFFSQQGDLLTHLSMLDSAAATAETINCNQQLHSPDNN